MRVKNIALIIPSILSAAFSELNLLDDFAELFVREFLRFLEHSLISGGGHPGFSLICSLATFIYLSIYDSTRGF